MRTLSRRQFNALLAVALVPGCTGSAGPSVPFSAGVARLTFAQFPSLASAGGSAVVDVPARFPIVVVRTGDADAVALSATCTHAYCTMGFAGDHIHCGCHDANFALDGHVLSGPTTVPIPVYAATIDADGISVQIDEP